MGILYIVAPQYRWVAMLCRYLHKQYPGSSPRCTDGLRCYADICTSNILEVLLGVQMGCDAMQIFAQAISWKFTSVYRWVAMLCRYLHKQYPGSSPRCTDGLRCYGV